MNNETNPADNYYYHHGNKSFKNEGNQDPPQIQLPGKIRHSYIKSGDISWSCNARHRFNRILQLAPSLDQIFFQEMKIAVN